MVREDKEEAEDDVGVHFFYFSNSGWMLNSTYHTVSLCDVVDKIHSPKKIEKSKSRIFYEFDI